MQQWVSNLGKFLRIFFGCHGRADRSFFFRGKQFPICARCTGELVGMLTGIPLTAIAGVPELHIVFLMMIPMVFDGFLQLLTSYESRNRRRFFTGILFGIAFIFALIYFHRACVWVAGNILIFFGAEPQEIQRAMEAFV